MCSSDRTCLSSRWPNPFASPRLILDEDMQDTAFDQNHMRYDHNDRRGNYINVYDRHIFANHLQG
ncbi:hypothetical protein Alide2_0431 [Alicycliphilus denitrificans K601]|uniref:Uncharacterized protein n=1 Tax=Alicycliphilus denitrificans (strain DSM 14773 / CIP 107495 / K601) TaxID=596154 RepID=F4G3M5_ALIDK|nr:hypothetical protein Alide2_0431 [Alicycliphilus denitrificans K601]